MRMVKAGERENAEQSFEPHCTRKLLPRIHGYLQSIDPYAPSPAKATPAHAASLDFPPCLPELQSGLD